MERCECELFIEKYYGLNTLDTTEKTEIKTDFGQLVNALVMFSEERAEANIGTSEKDLRVCEVMHSALENTKKKKVELFYRISDFEEFINRSDIEVIQVDIKVVEQSFMFQESFAAVVYYCVLK